MKLVLFIALCALCGCTAREAASRVAAETTKTILNIPMYQSRPEVDSFWDDVLNPKPRPVYYEEELKKREEERLAAEKTN